MARRVTAAWLRQHSACLEELAIFEKEWPAGVEVNAESLRRACKLGINLYWFADEWLSSTKMVGFEDDKVGAAWDAWQDCFTGEGPPSRAATRKLSRACLEPLIRQVEAGRG